MHTKGPWKQRDELESFIRPAIVSEAGDLVALVNFYSDVPLIEAAPDLLAACKAVLRYIASHQIYDKDAKGILEQAVAKAEACDD